MIELQTPPEPTRLTTAEEVFRQLRHDIIDLNLAPGSKISEVEVAKAFSVSRQPVREAFLRLSALNLLEIRPQRATRVRKISLNDLRNTRFVRAALEVEVIRLACQTATAEHLAAIKENLSHQSHAIDALDARALRTLDYEFHKLICTAANRLPAFLIIAENKAHTDRVCTLELEDTSGMHEVLEGHQLIFEALCDRDEERAVKAARVHLAHLDDTLANAAKNYPDFFQD